MLEIVQIAVTLSSYYKNSPLFHELAREKETKSGKTLEKIISKVICLRIVKIVFNLSNNMLNILCVV